MNTATWLQSTPAVALIDYYLHSAQHGLPKQRAEANEAAIQRWIDDMPVQMPLLLGVCAFTPTDESEVSPWK